MAMVAEALAGESVLPPCAECGRPADGQATAREKLDDPEKPWVLCQRCWRSLHGMRRVGPLRKLS